MSQCYFRTLTSPGSQECGKRVKIDTLQTIVFSTPHTDKILEDQLDTYRMAKSIEISGIGGLTLGWGKTLLV
jgi:hypothetical protein